MKPALLLMASALALAAQPKLLVNAQVDTRSAEAGLEPAFRALLAAQPQPAWIGYSVPAVRAWGLGCEYVRDGGSTASGIVHLEPPDHMLVLMRIEAGAVERVRALSADCEVDAGGIPVHWLNDVQPAQSVALLESLAAKNGNAVFAIAMHADPAADAALERFLASSQPQYVRLRAVGHLGSTRGRHGLEVLRRVIDNDPDLRVRERAVGSLAGSREPEAADLLLQIAKTGQEPRLRAQAVSGLGRKSGRETVATLRAIAEADPDKTVRRRALNSLESMPDGEGIPALIEIAKNSKEAETRKEAMSALERSRDPRTVAFFEEVLKH
jgi:hypothetical protein